MFKVIQMPESDAHTLPHNSVKIGGIKISRKNTHFNKRILTNFAPIIYLHTKTINTRDIFVRLKTQHRW